MNTNNKYSDLPQDCIRNISKYLDNYKDLLSFSMINKDTYKAINDKNLGVYSDKLKEISTLPNPEKFIGFYAKLKYFEFIKKYKRIAKEINFNFQRTQTDRDDTYYDDSYFGIDDKYAELGMNTCEFILGKLDGANIKNSVLFNYINFDLEFLLKIMIHALGLGCYNYEKRNKIASFINDGVKHSHLEEEHLQELIYYALLLNCHEVIDGLCNKINSISSNNTNNIYSYLSKIEEGFANIIESYQSQDNINNFGTIDRILTLEKLLNITDNVNDKKRLLRTFANWLNLEGVLNSTGTKITTLDMFDKTSHNQQSFRSSDTGTNKERYINCLKSCLNIVNKYFPSVWKLKSLFKSELDRLKVDVSNNANKRSFNDFKYGNNDNIKNKKMKFN